MNAPALELVDFACRYPGRERWTLAGVTLTVQPGEFVLVAGPTGSGKTTLARCLSGWIPAEQPGEVRGLVRVGGLDPAEASPADLCARLGIVLQSPEDQLFSTAMEDEIVFGLENRCRPREEIARALEETVARLGLSPWRAMPIPALSGGTKQRVAIAAMLALGPGLLVLDEPLSQLDPPACRAVMERLSTLHRATGTAIVLIEHRTALAAPWCERVVLLDAGRIAMDAPVAEAFADLAPFRRLGLRVPDPVAVSAALGRKPAARTVEEVGPPPPGRNRAVGATPDPAGSPGTAPTASPAVTTAEAGTEPLLRAEDVGIRIGKRGPWILRGLTFALRRGETVALLGANGAGKSTLLRGIAGITPVAEGAFRWVDGGAPPRPGSGRIGLVFQDPDLMLQARTVAEEVHWGPARLGRDDAEQQERESALIDTLRLTGLEPETPHALSRGQRQRVAIAAVLAMAPDLVCLDEPTTGQDRASVEALVSALRATRERALLVATQDVGFALEVADRVLVLHDGKVAAEGPPQTVLRRHADLERWGMLAPDLVRIAESWLAPPVRSVEELAAWATAR